MGVLRMLLAVCVLVQHSEGFIGLPLIPGDIAVQAFFGISGFYMSMILRGKYAGATSVFYTNRFLRLMPTYWLALGATAAALWLDPKFMPPEWRPIFGGTFPPLSVAAQIALWFAQTTLFGFDFICFFHVPTGAGPTFMHFTEFKAAPDGARWLGDWRLVGQAWSVSLEIYFYLLAPWLARRPVKWLLGIGAASLAIRWLFPGRVMSESHVYVFFPAQLWLFLAGMLTERVRPWFAARLPAWSGLAGLGLLLAIAVGSRLLPAAWIRAGFAPLTILLLPAIFRTFGRVEWDRTLGNLSYSFYLFHMLALHLCEHWFHYRSSEVTTLLTLVASTLTYFAVERPLDHWRQARLADRTPPAPSPVAANSPA